MASISANGAYGHHKFTLTVTEKSTSIEKNTSVVSFSFNLSPIQNSWDWYNWATKISFTVTINGKDYTGSIPSYDGYSNVTLKSDSLTIEHDDDGSKTISYSFSVNDNANGKNQNGQYYTPGDASASGKLVLTKIARKSKPRVSATTVVIGGNVNIYTDRKDESLTHTLTYSFGGATGTIASGVEDSYAWSVPDLVSRIPNKSSGTCTITCKTYAGSTLVGSDTEDITLTIPEKSTPSASDDGKVQMGKPINIYTNRNSTAYTHNLIFSIGGTEVDRRENVEGGKQWTPDENLASKTGNKLSVSCKVTCETYNGTLLVGTSSTQIVLTVPDATVPSLSKTSIVLGEEIIIYTPRKADCYEHDISYTLKASGSSTVALSKDFNGPIQESYKWTPSLSLLAPAIPSSTKGTITVTCTTRFKDSTTVIGTASPVSFTVTIPDNETTQPKVTMSLAPAHSLSSAFNGVYVQGKSKVKVTYTASSDYSTIASYSTKILGATGKTNPYTSSVLSNDGTVSIEGTVKDARGYFTEKTSDIEVVSYSRPRIIPAENQGNIVCTRCNSDGTFDPGGVKLLVKIGRKYSKVVSGGSQKNYCKLSYSYKTDAEGDSSYSDPVEILSRTASSDYVSVILSNIVSSNTTAYNIRLIAEDDVGESDVVTVTVPTAFVTWHSPVGGHGFTLGGYHDPAKYDVFDCRFDAEFQGDVSGRVYGLGELPSIPENADLNDYKDFGVYAIGKNDIAKTLANRPSDSAGTLRVWSSNGKTTGDYVYILQEYTTYDNTETYRRYIKLPDPDSAWEYKDWKVINGSDVIISQGLTGGWYWRKYANGTAECWRRVKNESRDVSTAFGSMYYANCDEVEFPFSFYSAPTVNATIESGTALLLLSWQGTDGNGTTTATKPASYRVMRPTTITGASFTIAYHAIGRWKE